MKKTILFAAVLLLLIVPLASADGRGISGGGGGMIMKPILYNYEECDALLDGRIEQYKHSAEKADKVFGIFLAIIIAFFIVLIISLFIQLGMAIQQIKDKGFRKWWSDEWKGNKDETDREKKQ